jgi:hypothetical protein
MCVRENLYLHFLNFACVCACNRKGTSHTSLRVDPHAGMFSVKIIQTSKLVDALSLREGYGKDQHWALLLLLSRDSA